jgi:hypothetical protein
LLLAAELPASKHTAAVVEATALVMLRGLRRSAFMAGLEAT